MGHESTHMSVELAQIRAAVSSFFEEHKGQSVPISLARSQISAELAHLGSLTRPIQHTLEAHGFVKRDPARRAIWPYPEHSDAWRVDGAMLTP